MLHCFKESYILLNLTNTEKVEEDVYVDFVSHVRLHVICVWRLGGYSTPARVHLPVPGPHCRRLHSEVRTSFSENLVL